MPGAMAQSLRPFFSRVPVFSGLEGRSLESVLGVLKEHTFRPQTHIFEEGELGRTMYVLHQGEVEVRRSNDQQESVPIVRLGPGECFGEMALVELEPRSASVISMGKVHAFSLTNLDLWRLFQQDNYAYVLVLQNLCRLLSRRLRKADSRISNFLTQEGSEVARLPRRARRTGR
jgi:CRP/FNR family transcriptional regulator, cyclic AMP receptor protein